MRSLLVNFNCSYNVQELGYDEASCKDLLIEFCAYKYRKKPYTQTFKKETESPLKWWLSINAQKDSLAELAIIIFSIPPSQVYVNEIFNFKWIFGNHRTRLNTFA
ncbi:25912_t:CDS:2 [Gigaspora rosea]|nr:25912_t:CDS:2 [Gigaspora rosea]